MSLNNIKYIPNLKWDQTSRIQTATLPNGDRLRIVPNLFERGTYDLELLDKVGRTFIGEYATKIDAKVAADEFVGNA